jgi:EmrB/QacA subfamily drug resistance transporter
MSDVTLQSEAPSVMAEPDPRRWFALVVIAIAQLMVVLDASIVNIALPKAAHALAISSANRQWAVTAYTLTFGGFLLLGGRIGDYLGRKRAFLVGLLGFAAASLLGGLSVNQQMLFGARALQGLFGALLAPAALSLISVTFTDSKERAKAFGVYGALSGVGAAIGLIAGGLLTQYVGWRWCLFVNTPMALIAFFLAIPNVRESKVHGHPRYDVPGALTATIGMLSIVFGVSQAANRKYGWSSTSAWPYIALGAILLVTFFIIESRVKSPLLPLRLITDRRRAGAYLTQLLVGLGLFGMFLFMTFYFQIVHGYSAVKAGLLFLPFSLGVIFSAISATKLLPRFGPRPLASIGCFFAAGGLFYLSLLKYDSSYLGHVMPAMLLMSLGLGLAFVALSSTALFNVSPQDTGAASAVLTTTQQVGGSFGTAIQNTIAVSATTSFGTAWAIAHHMKPPRVILQEAAVHGYDTAFRFGSLMLLLGSVTFFLLVNVDRHHLGQNDTAAVAH